MTAVDEGQLRAVLEGLTDPLTEGPLLAHSRLTALTPLALETGPGLRVHLTFPYPLAGALAYWQRRLRDALAPLVDPERLQLTLDWRVEPQQPQGKLVPLQRVANIIAVASGKGGVGKSTTAANLALALQAEGARVGLLDADIYGPSLGLLLGVSEGTRPEVVNEKFFVPVEAQGLALMSMALLTTDRTPMVWRGPMASGALQQMLTQTRWPELDYLLIDMPPGTGDIALTLSQQVPLAGAVIVTTPQDLALLDAQKGIEMFRRVDVPVLGIIENMSVHVCSACGHAEPLFGAGGGLRMAEQYGVPMLGALPLSLGIREDADSGCPTVAANPTGPEAQLYRDVGRLLGARLACRSGGADAPEITILDD
jgi:ATP-binding protein involved in chromosome partitioning